uniref:L-rhamnose mutarotase n=1 Tax=Hemiselmis andersenii TaxID=464988 RepID=A0A6U2HFW0_HEMAN|mmetsp:Transcript_41106/g.96042  ORF Transcript_41106/g.96042 Transcript_41106/m.96042 type:complete len:150 (+) Transcript_41106:40-489(+)
MLSNFSTGMVVGAALGSLATMILTSQPVPKRVMMRTRIKRHRLDEYKRYHQGVWPEVEEGLRRHGIKLLSIHAPADDSNLFNMYIEMDEGTDLARDLGEGSVYRQNPRAKQWEEFMARMFEDGSWEAMKEVYTLTSTASTNTLAPDYPD